MKSTKCVECGFVGWSDVEYCKACGAQLGQRSHDVSAVAPTHHSNYEQWDEPENPKKGLAIAALVLGILSMFSLGLFGIGAITGIILACVAMSRIKREPWKFGGNGIAIAGLILSIVSLVSMVPLGLIAAIAVPNLLASRRAANEGSAMYSLRQIASAQSFYQSNFNRYGTLSELVEQNLIDPRLASGTKNGYHFTVELTKDETTGSGFTVVCVPTAYGSTGIRSFFIDETLVIRAADNRGAAASKMDQPVDQTNYYNRGNRQADYRGQPVY